MCQCESYQEIYVVIDTGTSFISFLFDPVYFGQSFLPSSLPRIAYIFTPLTVTFKASRIIWAKIIVRNFKGMIYLWIFIEEDDHYRSKTILIYSKGKGSNMSPLLHYRVYL